MYASIDVEVGDLNLLLEKQATLGKYHPSLEIISKGFEWPAVVCNNGKMRRMTKGEEDLKQPDVDMWPQKRSRPTGWEHRKDLATD